MAREGINVGGGQFQKGIQVTLGSEVIYRGIHFRREWGFAEIVYFLGN